MRKVDNEEIVGGINTVDTIIDLGKDSSKKLFVLKSKTSLRIKSLIEKAESKNIGIFFKDLNFFKTNCKNINHQGIAILYKSRKEEDDSFLDGLLERKNLLLLILDHLTDPHNVGACIRSAAAANVDAIIVPKNRSCHLTPVVRKISSGGSELIPFVIVKNLVRALKKISSSGVDILGADLSGEESYSEINFSLRVAFVIGSEDKGLKRLTSENCDKLIKIKMPGKIQSLNASVSAGILLFEFLNYQKSKME